MYDIEAYYQATDVADAIRLLGEHPGATIISGGSDVLIKIREGKLAGCTLVSIHGIPELSGITLEADGAIAIGPGCTFSEITQHPVIQAHIPTLGYAADQAGGPQLRNIGTIGGNICNGVTSADSAATLLTLNAELEITGPEGVRHVLQADFYAGPGRVHLKPAEILTKVRIHKKDYEGFHGRYIKYAQREALDIATLTCAVHVKLSPNGRQIDRYRLGFGVAGPVPTRCPATEKLAEGREPTEALLSEIAAAALSELAPRDSWRASKAFREQLILELSRRATREAILSAGGQVR